MQTWSDGNGILKAILCEKPTLVSPTQCIRNAIIIIIAFLIAYLNEDCVG